MIESFVENNEISKSFKENLKDKLSTPVWGTFIITWIIIHWEFVYTTLFVSQDKIWEATGKLKNDYLDDTFLNFTNWETWFFLLLPVLLTYLFVWQLPKLVTIPAFRKTDEFETEKAMIKLKSALAFTNYQLEITKTTQQKTKIQKNISKERADLKKLDPTIEWREELDSAILDDQVLQAMLAAQKIVYQTSGRFTTNPNNTNPAYSTYIHAKQLSRLDVLGLVNLLGDNIMSFTEKGKFFLKDLQKKQPSVG